jgi:D-aminopeptidase
MNGGQAAVLEGQHGGGAGMTCHEFLGGAGTSSRVVNGERRTEGGEMEVVKGMYTVGVLCQCNYGHKRDMRIGGVPVGRLLMKEDEDASKEQGKGAEKESRQEIGRVGEGSIVILIL